MLTRRIAAVLLLGVILSFLPGLVPPARAQGPQVQMDDQVEVEEMNVVAKVLENGDVYVRQIRSYDIRDWTNTFWVDLVRPARLHEADYNISVEGRWPDGWRLNLKESSFDAIEKRSWTWAPDDKGIWLIPVYSRYKFTFTISYVIPGGAQKFRDTGDFNWTVVSNGARAKIRKLYGYIQLPPVAEQQPGHTKVWAEGISAQDLRLKDSQVIQFSATDVDARTPVRVRAVFPADRLSALASQSAVFQDREQMWKIEAVEALAGINSHLRHWFGLLLGLFLALPAFLPLHPAGFPLARAYILLCGLVTALYCFKLGPQRQPEFLYGLSRLRAWFHTKLPADRPNLALIGPVRCLAYADILDVAPNILIENEKVTWDELRPILGDNGLSDLTAIRQACAKMAAKLVDAAAS